jgi:tetratricopeptide (TPR) repeat protein
MKGKYLSLTGVVIIMLAGITMSGCVSTMAPSSSATNSMDYVRQHKGEGTRRTLLGSEAELMDIVVKPYSNGSYYTIVREPHAVLVKTSSGETFLGIDAFYFYPSQTNGQTEVEVLSICCGSSDVNFFREMESGKMLLFLFQNKYANLDLAINDLEKVASRNLPYLDKPANRAAYDKANLFIESLNRRKRRLKQSEADKETDARFQEALRAYQTAAVKPQMPEAARRFKAQAEDAVREKKFDDAADLYEQSLNIAPLWPEGHFNRALVLGENGDYETAAREMKRYLVLVPNASNARAAQDKIYVWERKAGEGN